MCKCAETFVNGKKVKAPEYHNCGYIRARNQLLDEAERIAMQESLNGSRIHAKTFNNAFSVAMEMLSQ